MSERLPFDRTPRQAWLMSAEYLGGGLALGLAFSVLLSQLPRVPALITLLVLLVAAFGWVAWSLIDLRRQERRLAVVLKNLDEELRRRGA